MLVHRQLRSYAWLTCRLQVLSTTGDHAEAHIAQGQALAISTQHTCGALSLLSLPSLLVHFLEHSRP